MEITRKQAGAELCQAWAQVDLPAEAQFHLPVGFQIHILLKKASFAHLWLF